MLALRDNVWCLATFPLSEPPRHTFKHCAGRPTTFLPDFVFLSSTSEISSPHPLVPSNAR